MSSWKAYWSRRSLTSSRVVGVVKAILGVRSGSFVIPSGIIGIVARTVNDRLAAGRRCPLRRRRGAVEGGLLRSGAVRLSTDGRRPEDLAVMGLRCARALAS